MEIRLVLLEDLQRLKAEIDKEMKEIFNVNAKNGNEMVWLKRAEVMQLVKVSPGIPQKFAHQGTISLLQDWRKPLLSHRNYIGTMMERSNSN